MMLTREVMGVALLGVLWVAALLVAAAAWQDVRDLLARKRAFRPLAANDSGDGLFEGNVVEATGETDAFASLHVEQVGRAQDADRRTIAFSDRAYRCAVHGGVIEASGDRVRVPPLEGASIEVWIGASARATAAECPGGDAFERAYAEAKKARGHTRSVSIPIRRGDHVFAFGRIQERDGRRTLAPAASGLLLVAAEDPRTFCTRHALRIGAFIVFQLAGCAVVTRLALWEPRFGTVSALGAALSLAFFLLATPLGVRLRQAARFPHRALLRGTWVDPELPKVKLNHNASMS
jgi:hypothetical protein